MASLKERQHQLREDTIIEIAREMLGKHGFNDLNMDELASQVGISKATLYQHFSSKDELVIQTILRNMKEGEETVRQFRDTLPPVDFLEHIVRYSVSKRISIAASHFEFPPHLREDPRIKEQRANFVEFLEKLIEKGKKDGTIRAELSTPVVIRTFFTIFNPIHQELLHEGVVTPEELGETLVTMFLKGIRTQ